VRDGLDSDSGFVFAPELASIPVSCLPHEDLERRSYRAAASGAATFALPEAAAVVASVAAASPLDRIRAAAACWPADGYAYHDLVRLSAQHVLALEAIRPAREPVYLPKAADELEPMLALWPHVLLLPTSRRLTPRELVVARAYPVHPLGLVDGEDWADGHRSIPAEFFFHDLDHARFKVRADLLALGVEIPDAYQHGTTLDPATGRHRTITWAARGRIGPELWRRAPRRLALAKRLLARADAAVDRGLADASVLLLFEILHEKSHPLDERVLRAQLDDVGHLQKIRHKLANGFYGEHRPADATIAALDAARTWLQEIM
jgi:hypothetical protein